MRWKESVPNSQAMEILIPPEISSLVLVQEIGLGYLGKLRPRVDVTPPPMILKSARANEIYQAIQKERDKRWLNGKKTARQLRSITKQNLTKLKRPKQSSRIYEKLRFRFCKDKLRRGRRYWKKLGWWVHTVAALNCCGFVRWEMKIRNRDEDLSEGRREGIYSVWSAFELGRVNVRQVCLVGTDS
jgi:hypothetical protein